VCAQAAAAAYTYMYMYAGGTRERAGVHPSCCITALRQHGGREKEKKKEKKKEYTRIRKRKRGWKSVESTMIETGIHFPPTSEKWPLSYVCRSVPFMETILQLIT
jgi:hypothetical protein